MITKTIDVISNNTKTAKEKQIEIANKLSRIKTKTKNLEKIVYSNKDYLKSFDSMKKVKCDCRTEMAIKNAAENTGKAMGEVREVVKKEVKKMSDVAKAGSKDILPNVIFTGMRINPPLFRVANACLQDALHDFEFAKKNEHVEVYSSPEKIKNEKLRKELYAVGASKNSRGAIYHANSEQAQKLWETKEIQDFIENNRSELKENKQNKTYNLEFRSETDGDAYYGIHFCKIYNPRITQDEYFEATLYDYYDFTYWKGKGFGVLLNNWAYRKQEKGELENYFLIFHIREKL